MTLGYVVQQTWIAPGLAALVLVLLTFFVVLSYVWNTRISSSSTTKSSWVRRFGPLVTVLFGPMLVIVGMVNLLFAFGRPESVVLRSYALQSSYALPPDGPKPPPCFEADIDSLQATKPGLPECTPVAFTPGTRIVDAGPLVERALDLFALNNPLQPAQLGTRSKAVTDRIHSVVIAVLSGMEPQMRTTAPLAPDRTKLRQIQAKMPQRWIALSIETQIIEGLALLRNVRNIAIERHVSHRDVTDPWKLLSEKLSRGIGADPPIVHLTSGSLVSSDAYVSFFGQPWLQRTGAGTFIYAMLLKGPEDADASLHLRTSDGSAIPLACGKTVTDPIPIKNCVSDFDHWLKGTTRLAVLTAPGQLSPGNHSLELTVTDTGEVRKEIIKDRSGVETILAAGDPGLLGTLDCLARIGYSNPATPLTLLGFPPDGMPAIRRGSPDTAGVLLDRESGQLWIYPADIDPTVLAAVKKEAISKTGKVANLDEPLAGLWLFPYVVRSDGLAPGVGQLLATPLTAARPGRPARSDSDPADGLAPPTWLWISRYDAQPVLFAYAMDNYVRYTQRISPSSALPIGWRIDLAGGRKSGRAVVWAFQLDLSQQGLLLDAGCQPVSDRAAPEPAYDSARFVPFWSTIFAAMRSSADKGTDSAIQTASPDSEPVPVLLDDATRRQIHMRVARFGMLLVLVGMLMHAVLMIWFRLSVANHTRTPRSG